MARDFLVNGNAPLKERAADRGLLYGAANGYTALSSDPIFAASLIRECDVLVADNDFLWYMTHPTPDTFQFDQADWVAQFAENHGLKLGATHLIWHRGMPDWVQKITVQNAEQVLINHIRTVAERYRGRMYYWTAVNEAIEPSHGQVDGLRNTPFFQFLGPDYIELTFRVARQADPDTLLLYNDYGLELNNPDHESRQTAVLKLLERLTAKNVPIDGVGLQSHLAAVDRTGENFNFEKLRRFLADIASMGLKIFVTEMTVSDRRLPSDISVRDRIVAEIYEDYLAAVLTEPAVEAVVTWGLSDKYALSEEEIEAARAAGYSLRSLPLDAEMNRKLAWNAIARAFDRSRTR
jgi:endo-1,4-beta-xylanase